MNADTGAAITDFLVESFEGLDRIERDLLELESSPDSAGALGSIFRTMHTIKGTCGFLGFGRLETLTHTAESLMDVLRSGRLKVDPEIVQTLFATVDAVRIALRSIETESTEPPGDHAELCKQLRRLHHPRRKAICADPAHAGHCDCAGH